MISFQQTLKDAPQMCAKERFYEIINSADVRVRCARIQQLHEQWAAECAKPQPDKERVRMLHDDKSALKKKLPAFIFQANFPKGRRKQAEAVLNGLYMVDFDNVEGIRNSSFLIPNLEKHGVLLVHLTPSGHGLRIVAKADPERGNLADNQRWLAERLGLPLDEACKDATRISFAFGQESLIYISEELFTYENREFERRYGEMYRSGCSQGVKGVKELSLRCAPLGVKPNVENVQTTMTEDVPSNDKRLNSLTPFNSLTPNYRGIPYSTIIAEWWREQGGEPVEGERNQKLHRLAANLRYICDNKAERLMEVMPSYGLSGSEMKSLCESACAGRVYQSVPKAMRAVLSELGIESENGKVNSEESDAVVKSSREELEKEFDKIKLPPALRAVTAGVERRLRVGAVLASLPMFYTLLTRIRFDHFDGTESRLSGMTFIIGPAASGKSFIRELDDVLMEPIRAEDARGREEENEYRRNRELNKNKKEQQKRPTPCIRVVPVQISNTMLALRMRDAVDVKDPSMHLHVYSCETELATAIRAAKGGSWIEKNDIYCKSFHNESWGMDYANNEAVNGELQVNLNLVVSGTEDAFDKLIPTQTVLSGLPTRLMYFQMPVDRYKMIDMKRAVRSVAERELLQQTAYRLNRMDGRVNAKPLTKEMYQWCAKIARRAELEDDHELDDLRKRTALIGERAGIVFAILSQIDSFAKGEPLRFDATTKRFARFIADYTLTMQYTKFAVRMREQKQRAADYSGKKIQPMRLAHEYNSLPAHFTTDDLQRLRPESTRASLRALIKKWVDKQLVKRIEEGEFEKIVTIL